MKNFFKSMFSENFGDVSFTRVTSFITIMTVLGTWVIKNIQEVGFQDFGQNSVYLIGLVIAGKTIGKLFEVAGEIKEKELDKN